MDNNIHINGNWERGVSLNFEAFVNKTNKPELDDVTPHPSPEG